MRANIHPNNYRPVIFEDSASGEQFLISSTVETEETAKWDDGNEYPLYKVEVSSKSHPFYTGERKEMDTAGRADKFRKKREQAEQMKQKNSVTKEAVNENSSITETEKESGEV